MTKLKILYAISALFLCVFQLVTVVRAQTMNECLQSFNVDASKSVVYIFSGSRQFDINAMSCVNAELFREEIFVNMDRGLYDSEANLRAQISDGQAKLTQMSIDLAATSNKAGIKALLDNSKVVSSTTGATVLSVTCATAVVGDAPALAACGSAFVAVAKAVNDWNDAVDAATPLIKAKAAGQWAIAEEQSLLTALEQQLDATTAQNAKDNYSDLFLSICSAVKAQCM